MNSLLLIALSLVAMTSSLLPSYIKNTLFRDTDKVPAVFAITPMPVLPTMSYQITRVLGQPNERETMVNRIVANRAFHLGGVHVDKLNHIYVFDSGNNRILGFFSYQSGPNQNADIVIGQPALTDMASANGNNTIFSTPNERTFASQPYPNVLSMLESPRSLTMATDENNNFYTIDPENNRVLKFNDPFGTDQTADDVWGQSDFSSRQPYCGQSGYGVRADRFCLGVHGVPGTENLSVETFSLGVEIDPAGNLWVADSGNHRVLRFPKDMGTGQINKTPDLILGQPSFTDKIISTGYTKTRAQMQYPIGIRVKPSTGEAYILEGQWAGEARILVFTPPFTNGMAATREIGRALYQDTAPSDTTNWEYIHDKWVHVTTGLYYPRGFVFDPSATGDIFVSDRGNQRVVLFGSDGSMRDIIGQPDNDTRGCFGLSNQGFIQVDGTKANICETDGEIGVDTAGNVYFSTLATADQRDIVRFATPLQRNASGLVISNGTLLHRGWNQFSGKTFQNGDGMSITSDASQLYASDGQRMLVWNNPLQVSTFQQADYTVGQDSMDTNHNNNGGVFNAVSIDVQTTDALGRIWVASDKRIFVFQGPITSSGKNYPVLKILYGYNTNVYWADDLTPISFNPSGVAFDNAANALWVSDAENHRILRIHDPLGAATVDMVIGQPNKTSTSPNAGTGTTPTRNGLWNPTYLKFDNFGNLYVVDASFELNGNRRVLRFNVSKLIPTPGNIFPLPDADAVFTKSSFTSRETETNQPGSPNAIGFDQYNRMILLADGYGNKQYERAYVYYTPHTGEIIYPDARIDIPMGQGSSVIFDSANNLIMQDHTWNRILFINLNLPPVVPAATSTPPVVPSDTPTPTLTPTTSPTSTPIPTPISSTTPTRTPTRTPTPTSPNSTTLLPVADSYVRKDNANKNFGTRNTSLIDGASPVAISYLKFDLTTLANKTIQSAKLRLKITNDPSPYTQYVKSVANTSWGETTITYNNRPTVGSTIGTFTSNLPNTFVEINITSKVNAKKGGLMSLGIDEITSNQTAFFTKENVTDKPQLVVQFN